METVYKIDLHYQSGAIKHVQTKTKSEALDIVMSEVKKDKTCCATVIEVEFEKEAPNKQWVRLDRYEHRNGDVIKMDY